MQDRNFVLYPFRDVNLDWVHPVLKKDISELIAETSDTGEPVKVCELENPIEQFNLSKYSYIAIEGNIGSGKTSLSGKISEDFKGKLILERFADNPFLPKFYGDQERYAFSLETSFLADRYHQLSDDLAQLDLFNDFVVADYHIFKSLIFSKITLSEDEYILYRKLFDIIYKETPKPDFYVYLYQSTNTLLQQIKKRGRSYEQGIEASYLEKINEGYMEYIKSQKGANIIIIDVTNRDFVNNQEDYLWVLSQIEGNL
jgi:deoxyadenosine/deoxycytidine kinase